MSEEEARRRAEELRRADPRIDPETWAASARAAAEGRVKTAREVRAERAAARSGAPPD